MPQNTFPGRSYALVVLALIVPCVLLIVPAVMSYRAEQRLADSFGWVAQSHEVRDCIERLQRLLVQGESGQRGFLITGDPGYLEPYAAALAQAQPELAALSRLVSDNATQRGHMEALAPVVDHRLTVMKEAVSLQESGHHDEAVALVASGRGKSYMDAINRTLSAMAAEEHRLLSVRQQQLARYARFATAIAFSIAGGVALFAVTVFVLLRRLARLEGLVTVCAWSRTVEYEGKWLSFEEYLQRRFNINTSHGISPAEAEKAIASFRAGPQDQQDAA